MDQPTVKAGFCAKAQAVKKRSVVDRQSIVVHGVLQLRGDAAADGSISDFIIGGARGHRESSYEPDLSC
jgi:hypothetical protein